MTATMVWGNWRKILRCGMALFVFVLVLAMSPWTTDPSNGIKILLYHWTAFAFVLVWLVGTYLGNEPVQKPRIFFGVLVAFLAVNVLAGLRSAFAWNSMVEISKFTSLFFLYLAASRAYRTEAQIRPLLLTACAAVAIASIYGLFQKFNLDPFPWDPAALLTDSYKELPATFGNPNLAAHTLVLCDIMALYLATIKGYRWCLLFLILFNVHHYFTGQRGGLIALAAAGVFLTLGWLMRHSKLRPHIAVAVTFSLFVVVATVVLAGIMLIMKARTGTPYPLDLALLVRYQSYSSAAQMIVEHPLRGFGPGNYAIENVQYWTPYEQRWFIEKNMFNANVHNDVLEAGIDGGVVSAGLYITFLVLAMSYGLLMGFVRSGYMERRLGFAFAALFCTFAVDGLFGFNMRTPVSAVLVFVMAGVLEGMWSSPNADLTRASSGWGMSLGWRASVLFVVLVNAVFGTRVFISDVLQQRAKGAVYWKAYGQADAILGRGEALAPWDWRFGFLRGDIAHQQGQLLKAVEHFERCQVRNPYYLPVLTNLSQTYFSLALGEGMSPDSNATEALEQSTRYANRAIELCPGLPQAEELLGRILMLRARHLLEEQGDAPVDQGAVAGLMEDASNHLATAIQNGAPNQGELWRLMAEIKTEMNDAEAAEIMLVRAAQSEPEDVANWEAFLMFAGAHGRYETLFRTLNGHLGVLAESPVHDAVQMGRIYTYLAEAYERGAQDVDAAQEAHLHAISACPESETSWSQFAGFASRYDRMELFRKVLRSSFIALKGSGSTCPASMTAVGRVWEEGPGVLPEVTADLYGEIESMVSASGTAQKVVSMGWAVDLLVRELDSAPATTHQIGDAFLMLGLCCRALNRPEQADKLLAATLPMLPTDAVKAACIERHAEILLKLGDSAEVLRLVDEHNAISGRSLSLSLLRAQALTHGGRLAEARLAYRMSLLQFVLDPDQKQAVQNAIDNLNARIAEGEH